MGSILEGNKEFFLRVDTDRERMQNIDIFRVDFPENVPIYQLIVNLVPMLYTFFMLNSAEHEILKLISI